MRRLARCTQGATALEFGLIAPIFFALLAGVIQFGLLFWTQLALQHGVEAAARCSAINATLCGSSSLTQTYAAAQSYGLSPPTSTFTLTSVACGNRVQAVYPFVFFFSIMGTSSLTLTASSCFPK